MSHTHSHEAKYFRTATGLVEPSLHAAIVCSGGEVLFIAAAATPEALEARVTEYVRENAERALFAHDAERVLALLECGRSNAAIERYFASVGRRWDPEHLHFRPVSVV